MAIFKQGKNIYLWYFCYETKRFSDGVINFLHENDFYHPITSDNWWVNYYKLPSVNCIFLIDYKIIFIVINNISKSNCQRSSLKWTTLLMTRERIFGFLKVLNMMLMYINKTSRYALNILLKTGKIFQNTKKYSIFLKICFYMLII